MTVLSHFIAGRVVTPTGVELPIVNPSTGREIGYVALATQSDVDAAVEAARVAFQTWSKTGLQYRADMMLKLRKSVEEARSELADIMVTELGKTLADATAEVDRAIEALGQSASVGNWYGAIATSGVSTGVDVQEIRYPIGVVATISPFNFPVMIPILQAAMAIACGNTVVCKASERDPTASLRLAELFKQAGLPDGVFNVVMGDRKAVDRLLEHPEVAGITFVGSTPVARHIRTTGVANNKRVQAFGGGKNHMVVMPDADLNAAADAAVSAAYGAAGQRCMAVSVVVAVGNCGDELVAKIAERLGGLAVGSPAKSETQIGPVISEQSLASITSHLDGVANAGAKLVVDGRRYQGDDGGWYIGPSLVDHVKPGMDLHSNEIFGPVLSVARADNYAQAVEIIASHPLGNGASIFTPDGATAKHFINEVEAGQIGVNVPIPFPVFFHSFGGWRDSSFTETKLFGPGALNFHTRTKTVSVRWPETSASKIDLGFPSSQ